MFKVLITTMAIAAGSIASGESVLYSTVLADGSKRGEVKKIVLEGEDVCVDFLTYVASNLPVFTGVSDTYISYRDNGAIWYRQDITRRSDPSTSLSMMCFDW